MGTNDFCCPIDVSDSCDCSDVGGGLVFSVIEVHRANNGEESAQSTGWEFDNYDEAERVAEGLDSIHACAGSLWFEPREDHDA